jgi:hypothetical protein
MKRMIAIAMLAVFATMGAQTAKADGVLLSDKTGVLLSDHSKNDGVLLSDKAQSITTISDWDVVSILLRTVNGVLLSD